MSSLILFLFSVIVHFSRIQYISPFFTVYIKSFAKVYLKQKRFQISFNLNLFWEWFIWYFITFYWKSLKILCCGSYVLKCRENILKNLIILIYVYPFKVSSESYFSILHKKFKIFPRIIKAITIFYKPWKKYWFSIF